MSEETDDDGEDGFGMEERFTRALLGSNAEPKKARSFGLSRPQGACDGDSSIEEDHE